MRFLLIFLLSVLPLFTAGQYTYFNTHLPPLGGADAGSGTSSQLMIKDSQIIHAAVYPNFGNYTFAFNVQNMGGELTNQINHYTSNGYLYLNYADAIDVHDNGFVWAGLKTDLGAEIRSFNNEMQQEWEIQVPIFYDDQNQPVYYTNETYGQFHFAKKLSNGDILAVGPIAYYNGNNPTHTNLWIVRYDTNQQLVWEKQLPLYYENIIPESKKFLRVNDLFELPNGDLLVWGCWYHAWQPMVLRFDSAGNFLSHTSWGSPGPVGTLNDWLPWPVQMNDEEFVFAYRHATYQNEFGPQYSKPRVGFFNATTMTEVLLEPLDHEYYGLTITDFEKTPDGGYVMLGYGYDGETMGFTFMIKLDENGEEEWFKQYVPTIPYHTANGWDVEITPDGGLAFVGNFFELDDEGIGGAQNTWVVKTDGCGEVEFNGCAYTVGVEENPISNDNNLRLWPNPASTNATLEYAPGGVAFIQLLDLRGKIILSQNVQQIQKQFALDISSIASGMYTVRVLSHEGRALAQTKLIKQ